MLLPIPRLIHTTQSRRGVILPRNIPLESLDNRRVLLSPELHLHLSTAALSIGTGTPSTTTADTLHLLIFLQLLTRHAANACAVEVRLLGLNTSQTAKLLIALLLPLGDEIAVRVAVLQQPVVERFGNGLFLVVEVVDVS